MQGTLNLWIRALFALLLLAGSDLTAQQQTYGGVAYDAVYDVIQTDDGGFIALGNSASYDPLLFYYDFYLIKTDAFGNLQWQKTIGSPFWESGYGFNKASDGGYILVGSKTDMSSFTTDVYVVKVDASGNVQWDKTFGGARNEKARTVQQTVDGGYVIFGDSDSFGSVSFQSDLYVIKISATGTLEWESVIGGDFTEWAWGGMQTADGGYVVSGDTRSFSAPVGVADVYLVKLDATGNQVWDKTYGDMNLDTGRSILETSDNGFIITGETTPSGSSSARAFLSRTDSVGNVQWTKAYGASSQHTVGRSVKETPDGGFVVAGDQDTPSGFDKDGYLLKVDELGNVQWENTYGGPAIEFIYGVTTTTNGGYVISGRTLSFGEGNYDAYLIRLDSNGENPTMLSGPPTISLSTGGVQNYSLDGGSTRANWFYWIFGSATGTSPGIPLAPGVTLPLNFDAYFNLTLTNPSAGIYTSFIGFLDVNGKGTAALTLPPGLDPSLMGVTLSHAYLASAAIGGADFASSAESVLLVP
jgi:hypothetical protein